MASWFGRTRQAPPPRPRPIVAAGQRVTPQTAQLVAARRNDWQQIAWAYRDNVPELRFLCEFVANSMARLRIYPAEDQPRGEQPIPVTGTRGGDGNPTRLSPQTQAAAQAAVDMLDLDRHGVTMLGRLAENLEVAGEAYLLGMPQQQGGHDWSIRSVTEIRVGTDGSVVLSEPGRAGMTRQELRLPDPNRPRRGDEVELLRLWNPHPQCYDWADAKISACMQTLEELVIYGRQLRAAARARISANGILYVPDEVSFVRAGGAPVNADAPGDDDEDPFMTEFTAMLLDPVGNDDSPAAIVPGIMRGAAMGPGDKPMADYIKPIEIPRQDPDEILAKRAAAVATLARGMDIQPERLTGIGGTTHWNGAVIGDAEIKQNLEPRAEKMLNSLTLAYLRPWCLAVGCPPDEVDQLVLWYDSAELAQPADPWKVGVEAHDRLIISDAALRRLGNFGDADEPSDREKLLRMLRGGAQQTAIPALVMLAGLDINDPMVRNAVLLTQQVAARGSVGGEPPKPAQPGSTAPGRVVDTPKIGPSSGSGPAPGAPSLPSGPSGATPKTTQQSGTGSQVTITAAAKEAPDGPSVAGVALMAADTGRVLMIQRALGDENDPAAGTWEFPGGHIEDGDADSLDAGKREWSEEVGQPFPTGGTVLHTWTSGNGIYQGHVVVIPEEAALDLAAKRSVDNPDDDAEQRVWIDPERARKYPDLRREVKRGTPWNALKAAVRTHRSPKAKVASAQLELPVTAAAPTPPEDVFRVDEQACRELGEVDAAFVAEFGGWLDAQVAQIVEKAAGRIRKGAIAASGAPAERALFTTGERDANRRPVTVTDPDTVLAVIAAAGPKFRWSINDEQALSGALDRIRPRWLAMVRAAAKQVERILRRLLGSAPKRDVVAEYERRAHDAWPALAQAIEQSAVGLLHGAGEESSAPDERTEAQQRREDANQVRDHAREAEADGPIVARSVITQALTQVGGAPERTEGGVPATGLGAGQLVKDEVKDAGGATLGYQWRYWSHTRSPFEAHVALSGQRFTGFDDPVLKTSAANAWIGTHYRPGDHSGCGCSCSVLLATPAKPDVVAPIVDLGPTEETPRQKQIRELAAADDAAGRQNTSAQKDRDRMDELRRHQQRYLEDAGQGAPA